MRNMEKEYSFINKKIFALLDEKGMSQKQLSELTGISTSAISDWKHKGASPSAENITKICKALNVDPEKVLGKTTGGFSDIYVIDKDSDLYEFMKLYKKKDDKVQKRILAYAIAMLNAEQY